MKAWNSTLNAPKEPLKRTGWGVSNTTLVKRKNPLPRPQDTLKRPYKPLRRTKLRKTAKTTVRKLQLKIWAITREIIIQRYGNTCYTCGAPNLVGSNLHLGHFIPSSVCSAEIRYSLSNLRPCCYRCNIHLSGNWPAYEAHLIRDGINVEELKRRNQETKGRQYDRLFYENLLAERENILKSL